MSTIKYKKRIQVQFQRDKFDLKCLFYFLSDLKPDEEGGNLVEAPNVVKQRYEFPDGIEIQVYHLPYEGVQAELDELVKGINEFIVEVHQPKLSYGQLFAKRNGLPTLAVVKPKAPAPAPKLTYENRTGEAPMPQRRAEAQPPPGNLFYGLVLPPHVLEKNMTIVACEQGCKKEGSPCELCSRVYELEDMRKTILGEKEERKANFAVYPPLMFMSFFHRILAGELHFTKTQILNGYLIVNQLIEQICDPENRTVFPDCNPAWYDQAKETREKVHAQLCKINERPEFDFEACAGRTFMYRFQMLEKLIFEKYQVMIQDNKLPDPYNLARFKNFEKIKTKILPPVQNFICDYVEESYRQQTGLPLNVDILRKH